MAQFTLQGSKVYFHGSFVPFERAQLSIASSPVLYGLSIYSVCSVNWNKDQKSLFVFRLRDHYERLINSAKIMDFHNFASEWPYLRFENMVVDLLTKNNIKQDALVRITVYVDEVMSGTKIHGLNHEISAFVYPMTILYPEEGISVCVSSWQRTADNAIPSRAKVNGSYVNASLMKNEALLNGYDDAIAIDERGHVSEGTVSNLFIIRNGTLITPDASTDMLEGITQNTIFGLAEKIGMPYLQRAIDRSELYIADEVFFCGTSVNITPVISIDKRAIGVGVGPITSELMRLYKRTLKGEINEFSTWLLKIPQ